MKKLFIFLVGLLLVFSFAGMGFAQEKMKPSPSAKEEKPAEPVKPEAVKKEAPPPPMQYRMGGIITAIDPPAKKITLQQHQLKREKSVTLILGQEALKKLPGVEGGDAVNVWVTGNTVTRLEKVGEGIFFRK